MTGRYPFSESEKFFTEGIAPYSSLSRKIDQQFAPRPWYTKKEQRRKRGKMKHGWYRKNALYILGEIFGAGPEWEITQNYDKSKPKLPIEMEWLLEKIYTEQESLAPFHRHMNFLIAIAKDVGVWPAPIWWRVKRRLNQNHRRMTRYSK